MSEAAVGVRRLVDAHHHLWDLGAGRYPWLQGPPQDPDDPAGVGMLQRDYLLDDLLRDAGPLPLAGSVHVEAAADPADPLHETRWRESVVESSGFAMAVVANVYLERPDAAEQLTAHAAATNGLRGVRQMLDRNPWTGAAELTTLLQDPAWLRGLALLPARGLVFDLQVLPPQLPLAAQVAQAHGDVTFALNHGGYHVPASSEADGLWRAGIAALAACPNVVVKASGYDTVDPTWPQEGVDRYVRTLLDAFGPQRVLFASNFPVDRRTISYQRLVELDLHAMRHLHAAELDQVFYANAIRVYRLDLDASPLPSARPPAQESHV